MDIKYIALSRVKFILNFYEKSLFPFVETQRLIKEGIPPYELQYSESDEPQFLTEWLDADQSIDTLGIQCSSLLCSTLKLFLKEIFKNVFRQNSRHITKSIKTETAYKSEFKDGWLNGYRKLFENEFNLDWRSSGVDLQILEEIILIRNRGQHPEEITMMSNSFSNKDLEKISSPFFIDNTNSHEELHKFLPPTIKLKPEKMKEVFNESIKLIDWVESNLEKWGQHQIA